MVCSITSNPVASKEALPTVQTASAASVSSAQRVDRVVSPILTKSSFEVSEFKDLVDWARADLEGREYKLTDGDFESFTIIPSEFIARLERIIAQGGNPKTLKEFEAYKITPSS